MSLSLLSVLSLVLPAAVAQTYSYGCYTEGETQRALTGGAYVNYTTMTVELCTTYCTGLEFGIWGIEYGGECYCGNSLSVGAVPTFPAECAVACPGDANETCGGGNHLTLFGNTTTAPVYTPVGDIDATTYAPLGCYTEGNGTRALAGDSAYDPEYMTTEACGDYCLDEGWVLFGTEYSNECWCGSVLDPSSLVAPDTDCYMPCSGDPTEVCGGPDRLNVYQWQEETTTD